MKRKIPSSLQKIINNMKKNKNKTEKTKETLEEKEILVDDVNVDAADEALEPDEEPRSKEEQLELDLEEAQNKHLRLLAEFQNFRQRASRMQLEQADSCAGKTVKQILPILDDFERAALQEEFSEGVSLVYQKMKSTLEQLGVKPMDSNGEAFNPEYHEAITEIPAPTPEMQGKIVDTVEKGYFIQDKILRFAKVVVGK